MRKLISLIVFITVLTGIAAADGVLIPRPKPWMPPRPAVNVKYHHVDVEINDPVAVTKIDQVFVNPYSRDLEADYIFPIPDNAMISRFTAWLGGVKMEAELLDAKQARKIYEDIVSQLKDPALLEYAGRGMYRLRVYPVPANGEVRIKLEYEQTLKADNGTVEYLYPLNTEKFSGENLQECKINVSINSFEDIGAVYCPTHDIQTERISSKSINANFYQTNTKPDKDFVINFVRQTSDFGFHVLSYREPGDGDGYFIGILSPPLNNRNLTVDKNVIFILDSSGSMKGEKIQQAKEALKFCLLGLNPGDYFNIFDYDDMVRPYKNELIRANKVNINSAIDFTDRIIANGGTNIYDALANGINMIPTDSRPTYAIFLTDGLPTVGNTNINDIISNTTRINEGRARLFAFGVGYDVNAHLLDRLSESNKGVSEYVLPDENIEVKVSRLASKINYPALTDMKLTFKPAIVEYIYPQTLGDLFYGSEIIITGRFNKSGGTDAILKGKIGDKNVTFRYDVKFSDGEINKEYIALLWANRRIGYLLQQIRLHGTNDELLTEVIDLSKKFGIVTEYTSFLVVGDEDRRAEEFWQMPTADASVRLKKEAEELRQHTSGKSGVMQSKRMNDQENLLALSAPNEVIVGESKVAIDNTTQVGAQSFFKSGDNWVQSNITEDDYDLEIKRFSKAYFQILDKDPTLGRYMALGDNVRFKIGSQVVQIADSGQDELSSRELNRLFPK